MLKLWRSIQFPLYHPEDNTGLGGGGGDKESIIDFLGADDDKEPDVIDLKPEKSTKEKETAGDDTPPESDDDEDTDKDTDTDEDEDEELDELESLEDELEGPTDEQLELVTPVRRQEILKKYPKLFKDFPYLEKAYYREQQFTELLPTIDDAKEAVKAKQTLDNFEADVLSGNTVKLLTAVKEGGRGFNKLVNNYLPNLRQVDEKAYFHVIGNVVKHTVAAMYGDGTENDNEDLKNAAIALNKFVFGTTKYSPAQNLDDAEGDKPGDKKAQELAEKERRFNEQRLTTNKTELKSKVDNVLKNTVLQHIDPKNSMTDYVKKNASRDALETLNTLIDRDPRFKVLVDKLWQRASEKNFDKQSTDAVRSAILSKAKTLLPAVIKRARNEALKGTGKRVRETDTEDSKDSGKESKSTIRKSESSESKPRTGKIKSAKDIPAGMSSLEFLNSD